MKTRIELLRSNIKRMQEEDINKLFLHVAEQEAESRMNDFSFHNKVENILVTHDVAKESIMIDPVDIITYNEFVHHLPNDLAPLIKGAEFEVNIIVDGLVCNKFVTHGTRVNGKPMIQVDLYITPVLSEDVSVPAAYQITKKDIDEVFDRYLRKETTSYNR